MNGIKTVYFDMDGVLTDFNRTVFYMTGGKTTAAIKRSGKYEEFMRENAPRKFFAEMVPSPFLGEFMDLMQILKKSGIRNEILTSYGPWYDDFGVTAHRCKVQWLQDHLRTPEKYIDAFNGVPLCYQKGFYGRPDAYLIDDQPENCEEFIKNGGRATNYSIISHSSMFAKICKDFSIEL